MGRGREEKLIFACYLIIVLSSFICVDAQEYKNPVISGNFEAADPGVIKVNSEYYVATTGGDAGGLFAIRSSSNLVNWTEVGHVFPTSYIPSWYQNSPWAPEIHYIGGKYIAYFAMRDTTGLLCVGAASSSVPQGPFTDLGKPLVRTPGMGSIDPTAFFNDQDNNWYLYYKSDGNAIGVSTPIWAQQLSADGLGLVGDRIFLFNNSLAWEGPLVEAPWVIKQNDLYYIFYSGNGYNTANYAIGVARSKTPLGPFEKSETPVIHSNDVLAGPGHCSVVQVGNTSTFAFFYAGWWADNIGSGYRMDMLDIVGWNAQGWPFVQTAGGPQNTPSYTLQPIPIK